MNMPGFTAETSLLNSDMRYQATTATTVYGEFIQPAAIFDIYTPRQPGVFACHFEYRCRIYGYGQPFQLCSWVYVCL
jgi:hypothetical protein